MTKNIIWRAITIFLVIGSASPLTAQFSAGLTFEFTPASENSDEQFSWRGEIGITTMSPGGTTVANLERATFNNFEQFLQDIIGQWEVTDPNSSRVTFALSGFTKSDFPALQLVTPVTGQVFQSEEIVATETNPPPDGFVGNSLNLIADEFVEIEFLSDFAFRPTLTPQVAHAEIGVARRAGIIAEGLLTNFEGDVLVLDVCPDVLVRSFTNRATIFVTRTILGDVNLDGSVDLLDIVPFVDRITAGQFQEEADINLDGSVDLLDVVPFVEVLVS